MTTVKRKPLKNVMIDPEVHAQIKIVAAINRERVNTLVNRVLQSCIDKQMRKQAKQAAS